MKILLVGEYSRLHNSLKEGLEALGHEVTLVSTGDGFKNYGSNYSVRATLFTSAFAKKLKNGVYKLTGVDAERTEKGLRFLMLLPKLKGYDHVQLINSDALETHPWLSIILLRKLFTQNTNYSLLVCGDETPVIEYSLSGKLKYSILTPYIEDKSLKNHYAYTLKYILPKHRKLFSFLADNAQEIITSDIDYQIPMQAMGYNTTLIPNPVNTERIAFKPLLKGEKVIIFLGINRQSYIKKGIVFFEKALDIIREKYPEKAEVIVTENIPYNQYINIYNSAHILLDQVYAYDQGYNALEAMAKGKVVFTGAETEFYNWYKLTETVCINALPDGQAIANELSYLIENPEEIITIGNNARDFIEREHNYKNIAKRYSDIWQKA